MAYLTSGRNKIMGSSVSTDANVITVIDDTCTDEQVPSAKAVYDKLSDLPTDSGSKCYTTLDELGLTADATIDDVIDALKDGETALISINEFTNYLTMFPNDSSDDNFSTVRIAKTETGRVVTEWFRKDGWGYAIGGLDGNNKFNSWKRIPVGAVTTTTINNYSKGGEIPTAKVVANLVQGTNVSANTDVLQLGAGVWNVSSTNTATSCINLPSKTAGKLIIESIKGNSGLTPYTGAYEYFIYTYKDINGDTYTRKLHSNATAGDIANDTGWKEIATKSTYNSVAELNKAKGTSITLVNGVDNTQEIVDTLSVGEQFISFYHNNANQNRFGIDASYGSLINEIRITKCLDADLTANYAIATAFMNTGIVMSRIYYKDYSTDWCIPTGGNSTNYSKSSLSINSWSGYSSGKIYYQSVNGICYITVSDLCILSGEKTNSTQLPAGLVPATDVAQNLIDNNGKIIGRITIAEGNRTLIVKHLSANAGVNASLTFSYPIKTS